jgi:dTDP-glucose pyrophosphorylase
MAGRGSRFREQGFQIPKYEIEVKGHSLLEWSLISLMPFITQKSLFVFICLEENHSRAVLKMTTEKLGIQNWKIIELPAVTDGQATSALAAAPTIENKREPILIFNIDTHVHPSAFEFLSLKPDPSIPCFHANGDHWSFAEVGGDGFVTRTAEKQRISDRASLGLYSFDSFNQFNEAYDITFLEAVHDAKERYIAPMYNSLIKNGVHVTAPIVDASLIAPLGTPEEVGLFQTSAVEWPAALPLSKLLK